jgi:hypothetical protein
MRTTTRYFIPLIGSAAAAGALFLAPLASADPGDSNLPACTTTGDGSTYTGTTTTECSSPGNVQINATAPSDPTYLYPWDDEFYGSALIIGGGDYGPHGGGGGGGGHR